MDTIAAKGSDGMGPMPPELLGKPLLTTGSSTLHQSYSRFSHISLIRTLITTLSGLLMPLTDLRELLDQAIHAKNTQDKMDPLDVVLTLLVHNTEILAGMTHAHPSKVTISLEQSNTWEENQEKDFTHLSTILNPR